MTEVPDELQTLLGQRLSWRQRRRFEKAAIRIARVGRQASYTVPAEIWLTLPEAEHLLNEIADRIWPARANAYRIDPS